MKYIQRKKKVPLEKLPKGLYNRLNYDLRIPLMVMTNSNTTHGAHHHTRHYSLCYYFVHYYLF